MRLRITLLVIASLGFVIALGLHVITLFILDPATVPFLQSQIWLFFLLPSFLFMALCAYFAMNDGVIYAAQTGWLLSLLSAVLRLPPYMLPGTVLYIIYAVLSAAVIPTPHRELIAFRGYALALSVLYALAIVVTVTRLHAGNSQWYRINRLPSRRVPPRRR